LYEIIKTKKVSDFFIKFELLNNSMQSSPKNNAFNLKDRAKSFVYAFNGIKEVIASQHNVWIHFVIASIVICMGIVFVISPYEWIAIVLSIGIVLSAEVFNSAIEALVDLVSPAFNEKAGKIKDMAAAAVLITALMAVITGCIIFLPYILALIK